MDRLLPLSGPESARKRSDGCLRGRPTYEALPAALYCQRAPGDPGFWTPDGRAISSVNQINGIGNVREEPVAGDPSKAVTPFTSGNLRWFDWSRDGRISLISRFTSSTNAVLFQNFR
jgi:hypothetical protein